MLEQVAGDVWALARPLRFLGVETGTRMTVIRLASGDLFVHSPVALDAALREAVDALGPVTAVVAPTLFHHLFVADWAKAYPGASLLACPGLERKRKDVAWSGVLRDTPETAWRDELDQVVFTARSLENEVVFFHRKSRTIVCADLIFDLGSHPSSLTRAVAWIVGQRGPGTTILERITIRDRAAAREQIARIGAWDAERVVLAHGNIIRADGRSIVAKSYAWL